MAGEGGDGEEKWWLCFDKRGRLCRTKTVVSDSSCIKIMEPKSGSNNRDWTNMYWTTHIIGSVFEATVYRALFFPDLETLETLPFHETVVAIKIFNLKKVTGKQRLQQEIKGTAFLGDDHPNVLGIKKIFGVGDNLYFVMPYMAGGSLQSLISYRFPNGFPEECVRVALRETLKGLSHIHGKGQLHKNVDAKYIFFCPYARTIKLAFAASLFELKSNFRGHGQWYHSQPYTIWPAPEARKGCTSTADKWLVGITALQLGFGLRAANPNGVIALYKNLRAQQKLSESFTDLVQLCLNPIPSRRPPPDELLRHSFFKNCQDVGYFTDMVKATGKNCIEEIKRS